MIKHIVMWRVRGETSDARRAASERVKQLFEQLRTLIPGLLKLEVGIDISGVDYACDVVLYTEFESVSALEAYAAHPEHLRVRNELGDLRMARFQVDYVTG
ncbi:MAG: Dabb family protein [Comamonadaceae bacterium]|nr:MAG: Dabb family protein [Comamonadaceae bacterium]